VAVVRRNILTNAAARQKYIQGVKLLKAEASGTTTNSLGIPGPGKQLSSYDLFVVMHHWAMMQFTPATQTDRNAAHSGPVFLPWHRWMLIQFQAQLQRVLSDTTFGLPYWNWAADGERPKPQQPNADLWKATCLGGDGTGANGAVETGPFSEASGWRVEVAADVNGTLRSVHRPLRRGFDTGTGLPNKSQVQQALDQPRYDNSPWNSTATGFRNRVEGWVPAASAPHLHNRVHVFVGGDMLISSSPNDPVFYLNHCNVDRIWAAWQKKHASEPYRPPQSAPQTLFRHRPDDPMYSIFAPATNGPPSNQMLNVSALYSYGSLTVA
jgi:tyrosinase